MTETENSPPHVEGEGVRQPYDLEERTFLFAKRVRALARNLPRTLCNIEDAKQLLRSSGSVGANYIEANESLGSKDFIMHLKISRKEAKESRYWLRLLYIEAAPELDAERNALIQEATEIMRICGAIIRKKE
ncbi:MAG: four helix bundle protein [Planctomycetota bacterium]